MSHTSQRRGLSPAEPGKELIVLAMIPSEYQNKTGIGSAMAELGVMMLKHHPENWILKNFTTTKIPQLGPAQGFLEWFYQRSPARAERLTIRLVASVSTVITALWTDKEKVINLLNELKSDWVANNQKNGYPISIVLSGLFSDIHHCCQKSHCQEHTYLQSLGIFGVAQNLPGEKELELITMCGHGLVGNNYVRDLIRKVQTQELSPKEASLKLAEPCVCGIVNPIRAEEIFSQLAKK